MLWCLLLHAGTPVDRALLLQQVWGYAAGVDSRTVETTIARIRRKIEPDPAHPVHLLTLRGRGYQLDLPRLFHAVPPFPRSEALVGRDAVLADLRVRLADGARLVTLTGPPGIGKTALARRLLTTLADDGSAETLFFADLAPVSDLAGFLTAVAAAVGGRGPSDADTLSTRLAALQPCVGLLDNFEQLPDAAAREVGRWLAAWPRVRLVATSHRALGLETEQRVPLGPLDPEAARALIRRIRDRRGLPSDPEAVEVAAADGAGHPLTLELVAGGPSRRVDRPERQLSLDASVERAVALLPRPLADAWVLGSGFAGPLDAAVATWLWGVDRTEAERMRAELVDRSLLAADGTLPQALKAPLDRLRATHPERVRWLERYARWAADHAGRAHLEVLLGAGVCDPQIVARAVPLYEADGRVAELDELLSRLRPTDADSRIAVATARACCWTTFGRFEEAQALLEDTLRLTRSRGDPESLWRLMLASAWLCRRAARYGEVEGWLRQAEAIARASGEPVALADVLQQRTLARLDVGDTSEPEQVEEACALYLRAGMPEMARMMEIRSASYRMHAGDWLGALAHLDRLLPELPLSARYDALTHAGVAALVLGRSEQARLSFGGALEVAGAHGYAGRMPAFGVAVLDLLDGAPGAEPALARFTGDSPTVEGRFRRACAALLLGDAARLASWACPVARRAGDLSRTLSRPLVAPEALAAFGALYRCRGL